jgi:hypothetical protein
VVEEISLFMNQKYVCWKMEDLLTNFLGDLEVVGDDCVKVRKN